MKAKIKVGWPVSQDFHFFRWPEEHKDVIFDVEPLQNGVWNCGRYRLRAKGFGILGGPHEDYGCGAVYTDIRSLAIVDKEGASVRFTNEGRTLIFDAQP